MKKSALGFTLVELLVVIALIAILAVVGVAVYRGVIASARDTKRKADIASIAKALEQYRLVNGKYPLAGAISCEGNWDCTNGYTTCLKNALVPTYIQDLPKDPQNICNWNNGKFYKYQASADGNFYQLAVSLENTSASTGNFTYQCAVVGCGCNDPVNSHVSVPTCIFNQTNGGFGYDSQQ